MIDGAMHYEDIEKCERGLILLRQITHLYNGEELEEHLAAIAEIEANVKRAKGIQANCNHAGWCQSDSLALSCGDCGASLWRSALDVPAAEYSWDVKAARIYEALQSGEAVPGWRLVELPDGAQAMEKEFEGRWPTDEP